MRKIKVLPVFPKFPLSFWGYQIAIEYMGKSAIMPPTGLATVLAMLPESFEPGRIIDLNVEELRDEQIRNADIVFTSTMIIQEDSHNEVIDRAHFYKKPVVAGGPFPTSYPERNSRADYTLAGEGEVLLKPFLEDLILGIAKKRYVEQDLINEKRNTFPLTNTGRVDIKSTPIPRWDLLDLSKYYSPAIQFSRGCPWNCDFCDITKLYGREPRTKANQQMIEEFKALRKTGYKGPVFVVDDNFIGNSVNARRLLPGVEEWQIQEGFPFSLYTEASMDLAWPKNEDILKGMVSAGFDKVFTGIESIDDGVLKRMDKGQNLKMPIRDAVSKIQKAGLEVTAGFIVGSDGESPDVFGKLYDFIQEIGIVVPMPGLLTVLKGTDLHKRLEKEGRLRDESSGNNTHTLHFNYIPQQDEKFLIEGYADLIRKLFEDKNYYDRCRVLQEKVGEHHGNNYAGWDGVKAFGKSLRRQLFARGGLEYFKYLSETAMKNTKEFPTAVARAITLDHFKTITRATLEDHAYPIHVETLYEHFKQRVEELSEKYGGDISLKVESIRKNAQRIVQRAEKRYDKLHADFRREASNALSSLRERINRDLSSYISTT